MIEALLFIILAVLLTLFLVFRAKFSSAKGNGSQTLLEERQGRIHALEAELQQAEDDLHALEIDHARKDEQLKALVQQKAALKTEFKALASDVLKQQSDALKQSMAEGNKTQLDLILSPFKSQLDHFEKQVKSSHDTNRKERIELKTEVSQLIEANKDLRHEAHELTRALRGDVKAQGNWGEMVLENLLKKSGLRPGEEYIVQESIVGADGKRYQPDVVLNLPGDKHLIIDSKVSLVAYERFSNTDDPDKQREALSDVVTSIRAHIKGLSAKNYQQLYDVSLDFVLLFIPIEGAWSIAIQKAPELYQEAFDQNIVLVTNTTLWGTLRTVALLWRQEKQSKNIEEIIQQASLLYDKFVGFSDDMVKVGKQMDTAKSSYGDAMNKLTEGTGNLVRRAENLKALGLKNSKQQHQSLVDRAMPEQLPESDNDNEG